MLYGFSRRPDALPQIPPTQAMSCLSHFHQSRAKSSNTQEHTREVEDASSRIPQRTDEALRREASDRLRTSLRALMDGAETQLLTMS
ncbi:hypothetical protein ATANTOWER_015771 [Ataeniobius toweri]|uniref:Uncharacterized protein n=1 Tax=Ataeniobius toweri TaxID=208326 RepID=A0ABU7BGF6_9TELE|nr:hypothetical protein [Ataeniobius toweri]